MYVVRGEASSIAADKEVAGKLLNLTTATGCTVVRVWLPHRQVSFGPRDVRHERYDEAVEAAREHGFAPSERSVGGHAVAYTGSTVAFARCLPISDPRTGLTDRYEYTLELLASALEGFGIAVEHGEPPDSFCPGDHSLSAAGKIVGVAQRVTASAAIVSGIVIVDEAGDIATVLEAVYERLGVAFDPTSVGSIVDAGGPDDAAVVIEAIERTLVDGAVNSVVGVDELDQLIASTTS